MIGGIRNGVVVSFALLAVAAAGFAHAQQSNMSFFVTSVGSGKGADFGGLEGADKHCQALAAAAGAGGRTWRAYLSTQASGATPAVNAKDRIGAGPWQNAKGVVVAKDVAELHGTNNLNKQTALTEKGDSGQRQRRHAEQTRHPDGLPAGRHGVSGRRRQDVRKLDEKRGRLGGRRSPQSCGPRYEPAGTVVELVARDTRLQRRCAQDPREAPDSCTVSRRSSRVTKTPACCRRNHEKTPRGCRGVFFADDGITRLRGSSAVSPTATDAAACAAPSPRSAGCARG